MTYYEHERLWAPATVVMTAALVGPGLVIITEGMSEFLFIWPAHLFGITVSSLLHVLIGRHVNRHVRVDEEGLWVDGELVVAAGDIVAVGVAGDPIAGHLHLVGGSQLPRPRNHPTPSRSSLLQHSWARVVEAPGIDTVGVVTRARDLARGSWLDGVTVVTKRWYERGLREAWIIASYRPARLGEALSKAAPDAHLISTHDPYAPTSEGSTAPGVAAPGPDHQPG